MTTTQATISNDNVIAGELAEDVTGVDWGNGWSECRDHLLDPSWAAQVSASAEPDGIALHGEVDCGLCRADEAERAAELADLAE